MGGRWQWVGDEESFGDTKGWDRISIAFHSRQAYRPNVSSDDFRLPREPTLLRTLSMCLVCGVAMTLLYVWFPLIAVSVFVPLPSPWYAGVVVGAAALSSLALFVYSALETRRLRRVARRL